MDILKFNARVEEFAFENGMDEFDLVSIYSDFLEEIAMLMQKLEDAMEKKDEMRCQKVLHGLKGGSVNFCCIELYQITSEMERFLSKGKFRAAREKLPALRKEADSTMQVIREYFHIDSNVV